MPQSIKQQTVNGVLWSSVERFSIQGIQFVLGIIMARLLSPREFGVVGMLAIFMAVAQSFVDSGFSNALIRKKNRTEIDFSTAFYFNIVVGIVCYLILFLAAPLIAGFYDTPVLKQLTRLIALNVFLNSLVIVQRAQFTIRVDFKTQATVTIPAVLLSGLLGIALAYLGYGVWALAIQSVSRTGLNVLAFWLVSKWRPQRAYSWDSFRDLFSFGSRMLLSGLLDIVYKNMYTLVIGKVFSARDLGFYTRAQQFVNLPSSNVTGILSRVTFPILSNIQDDDRQLQDIYRKYLRISAFVVFPLMMGLAALAYPLVLFLLTDKWEGCVILLQIMCFSMMWYPIHAINLNLLQVKGRSDLFLRLEIIKKIVGVAILCITIPLGLIPMLIGSVCSSLIALVINTHYTGKLIHVGFFKQMGDLLPTGFLSLLMGVVVWLCVRLLHGQPLLLQLCAGFLIGVGFYIGMAALFRMREWEQVRSLFISRFMKKK